MREHPLVLAYIGALIPALAMALSQPIWSRVDEAQHTDFIIQLSHGIYPLADATLIDPETLRVMKSTGVFRFEAPGSYPTPDISDMGPPPDGMSARANAVWMSRHMWQLSYESEQTPGYYLLMVPAWVIANKLGSALFAVHLLRVINALLIALLAPMAVIVARRLIPGRGEIATIAALFAILLPGLLLDGTRVSNDGLAAALGGLSVVIAVYWVGQPWTWRRTLLLGLTLGAAAFVKLTLLGLLPVLLLGMLWPVAGDARVMRWTRAAVSFGIVAICLVPWLLINAHIYGALLPSEHAHRLTGVLPAGFTLGFVVVDALFFALTYFGGEPIGALPMTAPLSALGVLLALISAVGLIKLLVGRPLRLGAGPFAVAMSATIGMIGLGLLLPATSSFEFAGPGRYAYPALPAAAALGALGLYAGVARQFARRILSGMYAAGAVAILGAGVIGSTGEVRSISGAPSASARILAASATGEFGGLSIHIDRLAFDTTAKATWVEVAVVNTGSDEAEWTVTPTAYTADTVATGDYTKSAHLPGDLDPGQSVTGWLFLPLDPSSLRTGDSIRLQFRDIAVDRYRSVGDVDLRIPTVALV